jgi:protein-L-isoaspartate(D-aspartate) O-methyltransferase
MRFDGEKREQTDKSFATQRKIMIDQQLKLRDIIDPSVLKAVSHIPRHEFVPVAEQSSAYDDTPLSIGFGQTISQPYMVALMTQLASPQKTDRALDIGSGSGYQAAVLGDLCAEVYGIELVPELALKAQQTIRRLGYDNIHIREGDGYFGDPKHAPFDVILVAAAADEVPHVLIDQLKPGGRLIIPIGKSSQNLVRIVKDRTSGKIHQEDVAAVRFVPFVQGNRSATRAENRR